MVKHKVPPQGKYSKEESGDRKNPSGLNISGNRVGTRGCGGYTSVAGLQN